MFYLPTERPSGSQLRQFIVAITPLCAARLIIPRIKHRKVLHLSDDGSRRSVIMVVSGKVILNRQKNVSCKIKSRSIVVNKEKCFELPSFVIREGSVKTIQSKGKEGLRLSA